MLDDWFSSLVILAREKNIVEKLAVNTIIDSIAANSPALQKLLLLS